MRPILIATLAAVALLAVDAARAQESFFNKRFCTIPGGANSGSAPDCSYSTWEQCRASVTGTKYCAENPNWRQDAATARTKGRRTGQN
jgi:hypothetical protein